MSEETLNDVEGSLTEPVETEVEVTTEAKADTTTETKVEPKAEVKADVKTDTKTVEPDWPSDWREKATGGDAKAMAKIAKYASPKALAEALLSAQDYISKTRSVAKLGKDATADQIKAYRESLGVPEAPDKYDLKDMNLKEGDKPLLDAYLAKAHATNQTPEQVRAGIEAYREMSTKMVEERLAKDASVTKEFEDLLRGEWGQEFRRNVNLVNSFLDNAPNGLKDKILTGRLSDGTPIGSDPDTLRWLLQLELERNPTGVVVPNSGAGIKQGVDDEIKQIEESMRKDRKAYDRDEKTQKRYRDLLEYRLNAEEKSRKAA